VADNPDEEPDVDDVVLVLQVLWRVTGQDVKNPQVDVGR
jgi:hypothetical protein